MDTVSNISFSGGTAAAVTVSAIGDSAAIMPAGTSSSSKWDNPTLTPFEKWQVPVNPNTNNTKWGLQPEEPAKTDSRGKWGDLSAVMDDFIPSGPGSKKWLYWIIGIGIAAIIIAVVFKKMRKK